MNRYVIALGSSDYLAFDYLDKALKLMNNQNILIIKAKSSFYKNCSLNTKQKLVFLNCCLAVTSYLPSLMLYKEVKAIEKKLCKITPYKNAPRSIDIDILFSLEHSYNDNYFTIPHSQLLYRDFFILPTKEVLKKANWPIFTKFYYNLHHRKQILEII